MVKISETVKDTTTHGNTWSVERYSDSGNETRQGFYHDRYAFDITLISY